MAIYEDIKMTLQIREKPWHYVYALSTKPVKEEKDTKKNLISAYGDMLTRGIILINILYKCGWSLANSEAKGAPGIRPPKSAGLFNLDDKHV